MENETKTPVDIVQEMIAIHTTRKEITEKLKAKAGADHFVETLAKAAMQSDKFIAELLNELSNFGDAVQSGADQENEYQTTWKDILPQASDLSSAEAEKIFTDLEDKLKKNYQDTLETKIELAAPLKEILTRQAAML